MHEEFGNIQHYFDVWHVAKCKFITSLIHIIFKIQQSLNTMVQLSLKPCQFTLSPVNIYLIKQSTGIIYQLILHYNYVKNIFICCNKYLIEWTVAIIHNINITYYTWFKLIVSKVKTTFPTCYLYISMCYSHKLWGTVCVIVCVSCIKCVSNVLLVESFVFRRSLSVDFYYMLELWAWGQALKAFFVTICLLLFY